MGQFLFWINEGLMAIFFFVVGLELKRGILDGQLSQPSQVVLPAVAAIGGMIVPVMIYVAINRGDVATLKGWATPVATDIAFALGVLSLFGRRISAGLKLFLLMLAIFDDIGAIFIIAFFYSSSLSCGWLIGSGALLAVLITLNLRSVMQTTPYVVLGVLLWFTFLKSGIHPTLAGILLAFTIPGRPREISPLRRLEQWAHPWVAYFIMPIFALANAGFPVTGITVETLASGVTLGIAVGLFVGKQLGVFLFSSILIKSGFAKLPEKSSWLSLYGVSLLCGIGFTMSLFLGTLSFAETGNHLTEVRLGVFIGSILSGLIGGIVLKLA